jgi:hypothetical protein
MALDIPMSRPSTSSALRFLTHDVIKKTSLCCWALLFIVRAFFNDTITVAVRTGFHVCLMGMLPQPRDYIRWCFAVPAIVARPQMSAKGQKRTLQRSF